MKFSFFFLLTMSSFHHFIFFFFLLFFSSSFFFSQECLTAGDDKTIRIWDLELGAQVNFRIFVYNYFQILQFLCTIIYYIKLIFRMNFVVGYTENENQLSRVFVGLLWDTFYILLLPRQNKMSENTHESNVEMVISTVLKTVCLGHFRLSRQYIRCIAGVRSEIRYITM